MFQEKRQRSPQSFLEESYFGSIGILRISTMAITSSKKSGDKRDWREHPHAERCSTGSNIRIRSDAILGETSAGGVKLVLLLRQLTSQRFYSSPPMGRTRLAFAFSRSIAGSGERD